MSWLWGTGKGDGSSTGTGRDPWEKLDPSLRDFLEKESPVKYKTSEQIAPHHPAPPPPVQNQQATAQTTVAKEEAQKPIVPRESLFQDGRYADIWSTYRPLADIEAENKTDQEKLLDVLIAYKDRRAQIGIVAVENCALENEALRDCWRAGKWRDYMQMCRHQNHEFERCYKMQARFLKALGYLSNYDRPPEVDEEIQMHADKLYHRMLGQERQIAEAKAKGLPEPTFPPLLPSASARKAANQLATPPSTASQAGYPQQAPPPTISADFSQFPERVQKGFAKRMEGRNEEEKELEKKAMEMEAASGTEVGIVLSERYKEIDEHRKQRAEKGQPTFGDIIVRIFGSR